jgi:putative restriction endonuclease
MYVYVYPTDRDWFDFLRSHPDLDEVNFWRPGGVQPFNLLKPGDLLLFRLKSPIDKIAGGGVYVHFSIYPVGLAWEAFGIKNGAPDERAFDGRIARYKGLPNADALPQDARIGCIILQRHSFFRNSFGLRFRRIIRGTAHKGCASMQQAAVGGSSSNK